jgi:hypothetical protein
MMATKVGSLKCQVIQVDGSGLDTNLHEVKFVTKIRVNLSHVKKTLKNDYNFRNKELPLCLSKG